MKRLVSLFAVLLAAALMASLLPAQSVPGANYFLLRAPAAAVPDILLRHNLTLVRPPNGHNLSRVMQSDTRTAEQVVAEVSADPDVIDIDIDRRVEMHRQLGPQNPNSTLSPIAAALAGRTPVSYYGTPVWTSYVNQPAVGLTHADSAHSLATGTGIVAVIDTGVDPDLPALQGVLVPGYDFIANAAGVPSELSDLSTSTASIINQSTAAILDKNTVVQLDQSTAAILDQSTAAILDTTQLPAAFGHGTMVAGIIHLVAPTAQIMSIRAFTAAGTADIADIVSAIYYAVDNGARVINMSFSIPDFSLELMKAMNYASANGVVCVASVGNGGIESYLYPGAFQNVMGVASTDNNDVRSSFSNFGAAQAHIAAPGEGILTFYPGGNYAVVSGTSFAAAFVSGTAALLLQMDSNLDSTEAEEAFSNAKKLTRDLGYGRLDVFSSVKSLKKPE